MKEKANILIFLAALVLMFAFVVILPPDKNAPEYENRAMADMPELSVESVFSGGYFDGVEAHLSDTTAYRTSLLQLAADVERSYGLKRPGSAVLVEMSGDDLGVGLLPEVDDEDLYISDQTEPDTAAQGSGTYTPSASQPAPQQPSSESPVTSPFSVEESTAQSNNAQTATPDVGVSARPAETGQASELPLRELHSPANDTSSPPRDSHVDPRRPFSVDLHYNEEAILYESYKEKASAARRYAEILNAYRSSLPENIRVFSMLAPIRVEFMGEKYVSSNDSQRETINKINDLLNESIIKTATYEMLAAHKDEYIHFRTDHHWTALGAYYAYLSFAEAAGFEPITISNYIEHSIPGFLGSFGKGTQNRTVRDNPDTMYYYELDNGITFTRRFFVIPQDVSSLSYRVFMGGDYEKIDFTSSNTNGKTLVVVKDSYANALIPWLSPHYERIIVIDPRQYGGKVTRLLADFEDADLLFMNYVAATAMSDFIETINNVR